MSSLASMVPEPSVSKRSKASRISCFCSSVSPPWRDFALLRLALRYDIAAGVAGAVQVNSREFLSGTKTEK